MQDLLFLSQRPPFPPNKGEKIRAFQILRHLAQRYRVRLGCLADDPADREPADALRALCADIHVATLDPRRARLRCLGGLAGGEPLTLPYFRERGLARWVDETLREARPAVAFVYSSAMAQYLLGAAPRPAFVAMDFVDVDSDKWRQYAETRRWPMNAVYRREARTLLAFDRRVAAAADASLFVSAPEAALFRALAPESADRIHAVGNGIDATHFSPGHGFVRPAPYGAGPALAFTGTMDYWPNVDAVAWFAEAVLPRIRARHRDAVFAIVGANPARRVVELGRRPGIHVTGRVADVRPWLAHAELAVTPMRIARGVQNKVLEAMAMARAVVVTPQALEGIAAEPGRHLALADGAERFAETVLALLADRPARERLGLAGRRRVVEAHSWAAQLDRLDFILDAACVSNFPAAARSL